MRYIVSGEFTKIDETSGTIQNTSKINVVEVSDTNEKGSGIMLYPLDRFTFSKSIYARCVDGGGAEVRVVPFEVGTQGGGEQGTTPCGGGSGIAFAGMILDTVPSTVDGGLWYGVVDGLPVVKMNHSGDEFILDTRPADDALIGNKLYLGGHRFQLTGFADGLTFSDNNFYAADTVVGSVADYQFVFTNAAALSVADGDTISITQLDTDAVSYSLTIADSLNTAGTPWDFSSSTLGVTNFAGLNNNKKYVYRSGQTTGYSRTGDAAYISTSTASDNPTILTLNLATGLKPVGISSRNWKVDQQQYYSAEKFAPSTGETPYVDVEEIYDKDTGKLKEFVVTIQQNSAIQNGNEWLDTISATASDTNVKVTIKFNGTTLGYGETKNGELTRDDTTGVYTFKTDTYIDGYSADSNPDDNTATLTKLTDMPNLLYQGDVCTISGLAAGLSVKKISPYNYDIYKDATFYKEGDEIPDGKSAGDLISGTKVGKINFGVITIENESAFIIENTVKNGTATVEIATVTDTEPTKTDAPKSQKFELDLSNALKAEHDSITEGFTLTNGAYVYHTGKVGWKLVVNDGKSVNGDPYTNVQTISYVPDKVIATLPDGTQYFTLTLSGLSNLGELVFGGLYIKTTDGTVVGTINKTATRQIIDVGTGGGFSGGSYYTLADAGYPTITLSGNNEYKLTGSLIYKTIVWNYSNSNMLDLSVDTYYVGYSVSDNGKTATYHGEGVSYKRIYFTPPSGYIDVRHDTTGGRDCTAVYWRPEGNEDDSGDILFCEFNGQDWVLNSHAFDGVTTADTINITNYVNSTPLNFNIELATDADTVAISRTFANETFTAGATAGTYTYTATGTTAGWNVSADGTKIASWEFNGKTFTIENLRTDLGNLGFDSQGYIHATNGSTIGRMGGNVIKLYDTAVHKLATPILAGADAADFTLILPS